MELGQEPQRTFENYNDQKPFLNCSQSTPMQQRYDAERAL